MKKLLTKGFTDRGIKQITSQNLPLFRTHLKGFLHASIKSNMFKITSRNFSIKYPTDDKPIGPDQCANEDSTDKYQSYIRNLNNNDNKPHQAKPVRVLKPMNQSSQDFASISGGPVQATTSWGKRYNRNGNIPFHVASVQEKLISAHVRNLSREEGESFVFSEDKKLSITCGKDVYTLENLPKTVEDCELHPVLEQNLKNIKISRLSTIQQYIFSLVREERDLLGCDQTGSGKTIAYLVPLLDSMLKEGPPKVEEQEPVKQQSQTEPSKHEDGLNSKTRLTEFIKTVNTSDVSIKRRYGKRSLPVALVVVPTRELCEQVFNECNKLIYSSGIQATVVYGGMPYYQQTQSLQQGTDIVIGTPGRLIDLLERSYLSLSEIKHFVIDEADRMLDMGFTPQLERILNDFDLVSVEDRRNLLFSATFSDEILKIARKFLSRKDYLFVNNSLGGYNTNKDIIQSLVYLSEGEKEGFLVELLHKKEGKCIVFVEKKFDAERMERNLRENGFKAIAIHGDKTQSERQYALRKLNEGAYDILIGTDLASRGLDISNVNLVVNYNYPKTIDDYIHRIGRTGRKGKEGMAISFISGGIQSHQCKELMEVLKKHDQEIPDWFKSMADKNRRYSGKKR